MVDAVYFAATTRNPAVLQLLLERGADPTPALRAALWAGAYELAELALLHGAAAGRAVANGKPLLNDLIRWGQIQPAVWLLERGASPNVADANGWTAVLEAGSDTKLCDRDGNTPRDVTGSEKVCQWLSRQR